MDWFLVDESDSDTSDTSSTRSPDTTDPQLSQRIWLEVGHTYERRYWKSGRAVPEDWRVWVRGVAGADVDALVDKVVFQLHPDTQFPYPKRIILEAPFELQEAGSAPSELLIDIHMKCSTKPEQFRVTYGSLFSKPEESRADSRCVFYDVKHPSAQLRASLEQAAPPAGGGARAVLPARPRPRPPPAAVKTKKVFKHTEHERSLQKKPKLANDSIDNFKMIMTTSSDSGRRCHRCRGRVIQCPSCQSPRAR